MSDWLDLVPGGLSSPPSWRWDLAAWLTTTGRAVPARYLDSWVDRARRHLTARRGSRRDPAVRQAAELHLGEARLRRAHLQAYLLTGQPLSVVAGRCDLPAPAAEAYRKLCFDVNLKARDKVALIIGPGLAAGFGGQDVGRLWLAFGYHAGLAALDTAVAISVEDGLVGETDELPRTAPAVVDARLRKSVRLALDAMRLPADTPLPVLAELLAASRRIASRPRPRSVSDTLASAADILQEVPDLDVLLPPEDATTGSVA
jgi:hypothetical protein